MSYVGDVLGVSGTGPTPATSDDRATLALSDTGATPTYNNTGDTSAVTGPVATLAIKDAGATPSITSARAEGGIPETEEQKAAREEAKRLLAWSKDILVHEKLKDSMFYI